MLLCHYSVVVHVFVYTMFPFLLEANTWLSSSDPIKHLIYYLLTSYVFHFLISSSQQPKEIDVLYSN